MRKTFGIGLGLALIAGGVAGCMSGSSQVTIDALSGSTSAYNEAFIEYRGPQARWAGPNGFVMHVVARDREQPVITVPAAWAAQFKQEESSSSARRPASQLITGEEARAKLSLLASAVQEGGPSFQGCLYPVHVRLVREDGSVLDEQGCRNLSHWSSAASDTVDYFMSAAAK